jgi:hypothetical protein
MGFDLWLVADPERAERRPTRADVELAFDGLVRRHGRDREVRYIEVGKTATDNCEIYCSEGDPQVVVTVSRPVPSEWLWERLFNLLWEFDVFAWWGDETALVAREDVPTPPDMNLESIRVSDPAALMSAVIGA